MNVLVIGGCGLVGRHIIQQLEKDPAFAQIKSFDITPKADITGDITKLQDCLDACCLIDIVIHTASPPHGKDSSLYYRVNVEGTRNIIKACKIQRVKRLVFTSSARFTDLTNQSVVFNGQHLLDATEELPYCKVHIDAYNETKAIAEKLVLDANDQDLLTIALRPSGIFGPGDMQGSFAIYKAAKEGNYKYQVGDNKTLFDMTFVENVAHAHVLAAKNLAPDNSGEAYNITNDQPVFWFDFARAIYTGLGKTPCLQYKIPFWLAFPLAYISEFFAKLLGISVTFTVFRMIFLSRNRVFSIEKAREKLGYVPIVSLEEGVYKTVEWLKTLD